MAFNRKTWKNRTSEYPSRRKLAPAGTNIYDVSREEGLVFEEGDRFDAATMNDLEGRVEAAVNAAEATASAAAAAASAAQTKADAALPKSGGTATGAIKAMANPAVGTSQVRNIHAGTADLTPGVSALATGSIYFVYET